jgi:L-lactate dehydrogenase complex protein LldG
MEESTSREKILKNIRNALISKLENPFQNIDFDSPIYKKLEDSLDITFAQELTIAGGKFIYCENHNDFVQQLVILMNGNSWRNVFCKESQIQSLLSQAGIPFKSDDEDFSSMKAGLTTCEFLISRRGSILVSSARESGRKLNFFPETHLVLAYSSQLVPDIKNALEEMQKIYKDKMPSMTTLITGPSRTADIEKTLVMGVHGPKDVYVFFVDDQS